MTMTNEPAELLASTGYLLARVGSESRRRFVEALAAHDLSLSAYSVLMLVAAMRGVTQRMIGDAAGIDPRNLVPILDDLDGRGLIMRDPHPKDRRRHAVSLSAAGRAKLTRLRDAGAQAEHSLLEPLTPVERRQLHALLRKLLPD